MENQDRSKFNDQLRERTIQMAAKLYWLLKDRKVSWIIRPGVNQILRSSSSVAANFRAATRARSDAEFYAKICIVVEECDETLFWLDYLMRINFLDFCKTKEIYSEVEQLVRLFNAIKSKMKIKIGGKKSEI
ncbi:MAG: four helix bundle protein [Bacteroidetes bacterium]|nr:four helix bundle protein [Bacteroidota bacterium]